MQIGALFIDGVALAVAGGFVGGLLTVERKNDPLKTVSRAFLQIALGMSLAGALAEKYMPPEMWWQCIFVGLVSGMVAGHVPDVIKAVAPKFIQNVIEFLTRKLKALIEG